jgi:DNA invertase Pin-like site-specific DNA recombinase
MMEELRHVKRAAGLLRISTDKTDAAGKKVNMEETLRNHEEKITSYCKEMDWELTTYKEVLSGGTEYEDRIELKALLNDLEQYDVIVVMELQRLSRQHEVSGKIKTKILQHGTLIVTLNPFQIYDMANNSMDALMYDIGSALSEYERRVASQRVRANKMSMSRQGLNSSGSVAFGYKRNPETKKLEIIEEEAIIVKKIFDWYIEGKGQAKICEMLNDMGIKNKQGNKWVPQSLRYLLQCKTYKGTLVAHSYGMKHGKQVIVDYVEKPDAIPKIIEPEIFEKAQKMREVKRERHDGTVKRARERTERKHQSILHDLVFCACCGRKSTIKWTAPRQAHYIRLCPTDTASGKTCSNGGSKLEWVEAAVIQKILEHKKEIENNIYKFESNDFEDRINDLKLKKEAYTKALNKLAAELRAIKKLEMKYEIEVEETGLADPLQEEEFKNDKLQNQNERMSITKKLEEVNEKLNAPTPEKEIKKLNEKIQLIEELENADLNEVQINNLLKQFILKIHYKRVLPEKIAALGNKNPIRNNYPAEIEIEYID